MNPELYDYVLDRLFEAGARDVTLSPIQMKKNRPGTNVTVLVHPRGRDQATAILFRESTTLGVRTHAIEREVLERRITTVRTRFGKVRVKEGLFGGKVVNVAPEFEDCRRIARAKKVSLKQVQQAAIASYETKGQTKGKR